MKRVLVIGGGIYQIPVIKRIIERGYEDVVGKFASLGADIKKVTVPDPVEAVK